MAWVVLVLSGVLEAVWAVALGRTEGFSRPVPSVVFVVGLVLSMLGLAYAMRTLPVGTAYAVWVGIGAALTVGFGMATGAGVGERGQGAAHRRARRLRGRVEARPLTGSPVVRGRAPRCDRPKSSDSRTPRGSGCR